VRANEGVWQGKASYVVLVREHEQLARHLLRLQDVERGQALGDGEAVVQLAVDDLDILVSR
jgi:hypothetical protein